MRPIREALPPSIKRPIGEKDLKSRIVLVVDDNEANRETAGYFLIKMNCRVEYAVNGQEAVGKTMDSKYDLILMDVRMPVMDGIDASMKIRESGNPNHSTPIVVLSAFLSTQLEEECSETGVDRCLSKPFNLDQLYEVINASIDPR